MTDPKPSREIKITRIYDAPVETVWEAWCDPVQAAQWWGPRGFSITTHSKDLRVGGTWEYTMHGPDGVDYPNSTLYHEVKKHTKLVYDHGGYKDRPPLFRVTVLFTNLNLKTEMEMTMLLETPEAAEETRKFIKKAGGDATWDRLSEYLAKTQSGQEIFAINRTFHAPIKTLFEVWTNPKHLAAWVAPSQSKMEFIDADIREGQGSFYSILMGNESVIFGKTHYKKITPPDHIIYTQQFCDKNRNVSRHPFAPNWPETMLTTVLFTAESETQTRVSLTWKPIEPCKPEELETFIKARSGMFQGWSGSFDQLDAFLESLQINSK